MKRFWLRPCFCNTWRGQENPLEAGLYIAAYVLQEQYMLLCRQECKLHVLNTTATWVHHSQPKYTVSNSGATGLSRYWRHLGYLYQWQADKHRTVQEHLMFVWEEPSDFHKHRSTWSQKKPHSTLDLWSSPVHFQDLNPFSSEDPQEWTFHSFTETLQKQSGEGMKIHLLHVLGTKPASQRHLWLLYLQTNPESLGMVKENTSRAWRFFFQAVVVVTKKVPSCILFALMLLQLLRPFPVLHLVQTAKGKPLPPKKQLIREKTISVTQQEKLVMHFRLHC